jgi:aryl-alcohol dehydrogenase-like predicted oxidoreductase
VHAGEALYEDISVFLGDIAATRGQMLAQLALAWALRDPRIA